MRGARSGFFGSVERISQFMGNLFYRGQQITVIRSLKYSEMKYWNGWHEIMAKEESKALVDKK